MTTLENDRLPAAAAHRAPEPLRKVWDLPVRLVHWGLVVALAGAYVTNKLGAGYFTLHLFFGYATIILVTFRILWGFVGTRHARFAHFVEGPRGVLRYVSAVGRGRHTRYVGHNPLGALMVLTLLALVGAQAVLGLFGDDEIFNSGPLAGLVTKQQSLFFTSLHRKLFYVILAAAGLHVAAVLAHVAIKKEPLIHAMIHGSKPGGLVEPDEAITSSRGRLAFILTAAIIIVLAVALQFTPTSTADLAAF
ncbi:cytochrome b/b6 domain-containing protein [Methylocystis parvus]|uniref:Cytochrome B n=1 Tax=Methylocystis parvus TaxID=134 RepID=A0A6B8MAU6_9HYPH|nr:cytochrome b/b6 domain-containing protein [Methylocystis parvus]QGM97780.1 cytochrome B [Methylocystis parvus]WBK01915.1 cytochrome b/b6 domain-containing protein [Methylocystis parvus OBBP]